MPLDRQHVTAASRIMLPLYVIFFGGLGLNYILTPVDRLVASPALRYANTLMPLDGWGYLFLGCSLLMLAAMAQRRRAWFRFALLMCCLSMAIWTVTNAAAAFNSDATPGGWLWPMIVGGACLASYRSLTYGEV